MASSGGGCGQRDTALPARVAIIGLGLIGGSLGLALRRPGVELIGYDPDPAAAAQALRRGVVDTVHGAPGAALHAAGLAVLCVPPDALAPLLRELASTLEARTVLCDTGSIKRPAVAAAREALGAGAVRFVPAHPIAGRELGGVAAATAELYRGCRVILTPVPTTDAAALQCVERLWYAAGADTVQRMDAERHDVLLAACSHLPHLLAFALVDYLAGRPDADAIFRCAAGGFADFTRIAASDPVLWRQIGLANRDSLVAELEGYGRRIEELARLLGQNDVTALEAILERAAAARRRYVDPRRRGLR